MQFNETLALLRKSWGYTQEQLAERLGVSRQAIARWEAGETAPDVRILKNLCEIFGISADNLINGIDESSLLPALKNPPEPVSEAISDDAAPPIISAKTRALEPRRGKLKSAAVIMAISAAAVALNIGIIKHVNKKYPETENIYSRVETDIPKLTSLSNAPKIEFWTAEEYEKWAEEQRKIYREKFESGEKILWHTDGGDISRALTEDDLKNIEKALSETLSAIKNGDLFTKDETLFWTNESGETCFVTHDDAFVTADSEETSVAGISDDFVIFDDAAAESVAQGSEENAGNAFEDIFAKYTKYGLKYVENNGKRRLYYNGKAVGKFIDVDPEGGVFTFIPDGNCTLTVQTEYDWEGNLCGVGEGQTETD